MPKTVKQKTINLIPQDEFESSMMGRVLKWALSSFRVMVIATELIVMSAFLSRFWLDARNSDLNEELEIAKAQVGAYTEIETAFRQNQQKLEILKQLYSESKLSETVNVFSKLIPADITLNSISIVEGLLQLRAGAFSENSIAQFIVNLEKNLSAQAGANFNNINLSQVSSSTDNSNLTLFTITGEVGNIAKTKHK